MSKQHPLTVFLEPPRCHGRRRGRDHGARAHAGGVQPGGAEHYVFLFVCLSADGPLLLTRINKRRPSA